MPSQMVTPRWPLLAHACVVGEPLNACVVGRSLHASVVSGPSVDDEATNSEAASSTSRSTEDSLWSHR